MSDQTAALTLCMLCPSPCRRMWPADRKEQNEAITPSSLSLVAVMLERGEIALGDEVVEALGRTEMARTCRAGCPYDYDIAGYVQAVLEEAVLRTNARDG